MPNHLISETSPYLLQHAHQPVDWYPYSSSIFEQAKIQDKPLIISIGYSTCHWCHVMAHECFDDAEVADIMNQFFISVKVDREELPDVDKYYMNAMQALTGHGGWPLNAFVLPNGKAFYAVTYLPKERWKHLLMKIHQLYQTDIEKLYEYAESIHQGIIQMEWPETKESLTSWTIDKQEIKNRVEEWKMLFDKEYGGHLKSPKFVMPVNFQFLLKYLTLNYDKDIEQHVQTSFLNIVLSGLYDHVEGGFYRYSTDRFWKIPHFEKMLYDNAQLIEWLSNYHALLLSSNIQSNLIHISEWILQKTINFINKQFLSNDYLFYSAYDADSDGEEGKFYYWTLDELQSIITNDYSEFAEIFNISNQFGYWEHGKYVLTINIPLFLKNPNYWISKINQWCDVLKVHRDKRNKPSLDTKIITSWNALMIKALAIASISLKNKGYLEMAEKALQSLLSKVLLNNDLFRIYHKEQIKIPAYLDDYAYLIDACIQVSKASAHTQYLQIAELLIRQAIDKFYSAEKNIFYYSSITHNISNTVNLYDDVIPSANAIMINNLIYFYHLTNKAEYKDISNAVLQQNYKLFLNVPQYATSYGSLLLSKLYFDTLEIVIAGNHAQYYLKNLYSQIFFINEVYVTDSNIQENEFPIFQNRFHPQKTFIYTCQNHSCYEPIEHFNHFDIRRYL